MNTMSVRYLVSV